MNLFMVAWAAGVIPAWLISRVEAQKVTQTDAKIIDSTIAMGTVLSWLTVLIWAIDKVSKKN